MTTLLLRIDAPMQAWGTQSHFSHRDTGREPSKSGIIGLLCAALGRPCTEAIDDLARLKMGLRLDQPGTIRRDFHTAGKDGHYKVSGKAEFTKSLIPSDRFYLSDAKFLVGLEGDSEILEQLQYALQNPAWFLFFGRKAFVPAERIWLPNGLQDTDLIESLSTYHWLGQHPNPPKILELIVDDSSGVIVRNDHPLSFKPRRFIPRQVSKISIDNPACQQEV